MNKRLAAVILLAATGAFLPIQGCSTPREVVRKIGLTELSGQARSAAKNGDDERALELWREYIERRPHAHYAEYELGLVESRLGLHDDAITHLTIAHDLRPMNTDYIDALANEYLITGQTDKMMTFLRRTSGEGGAISGYLRTAKYAGKAGLLDDARLALRQAVALDNGQTEQPHIAVADFARETGNKKLEIQALRRALWFDPSADTYDARFIELGVTPGPSLAIDPLVEYEF